MNSTRWRQCTLTLLLGAVLVVVGSAPVRANEESALYKTGEAAAFARFCGQSGFVTQLREHFGGYREFKRGFNQNLNPELYIWRVDCDGLEQSISEFLNEVSALEAKRPPGTPNAYVKFSADGRNAANERVYDDLMSKILAEDATWIAGQDGDSAESIGTYRSRGLGNSYHKSLAACLKWNSATKSIEYLVWNAYLKKSTFPKTKDSAFKRCKAARDQNKLDCRCFTVDVEDTNALSLPEDVLVEYKRQMDAVDFQSLQAK